MIRSNHSILKQIIRRAFSLSGVLICLSLHTQTVRAQDILKDANSIIVEARTEVLCKSMTQSIEKESLTITVLNHKGLDAAHFFCGCDMFRSLQRFSGEIINAGGQSVRKIKKGELQKSEYSSSLSTDDYFYYYECNYPTFPFTVKYEWEVKCNNGLIGYSTFIPQAYPNQGVEKATYRIELPAGQGCRYRELNTQGKKIQVKEQPRLLETVKDTINFVTPIQGDEVLPSVGDSFIYKCKVQLDNFSELKPLISTVDTIDDVIVINGSQDFEMIKDVGSVLDIAERYDVREVKGTHAIGHTRFSTESGVDRYHAHPFETYIVKDVSVVHNGQITNYWNIRDPLERKGHVFETFNDTECLVHYIADKLDTGYSLEEALEQSVEDMDGPFSYIIGTPNGIGIAKDKLGLRPGVMAETDDVFAIASEEVSLREVVDTQNIEQISPGEVMVYEI